MKKLFLIESVEPIEGGHFENNLTQACNKEKKKEVSIVN